MLHWGGINVSQLYDISLPTNSQFNLSPNDWMKKTIPLKGVIIGIPFELNYSSGGASIHTKNIMLSEFFYSICDALLKSDSSLSSYSLQCLVNPFGGIDTNRGNYYNNGGTHPTWEIINGIYIANKLSGSVSGANKNVSCKVRFIW